MENHHPPSTATTPGLPPDPGRVVLTRAEYDRLVARAEDNIDATAIDAYRLDPQAAMAGALTGEEFDRILIGVHPLTIWRERAKFSQRALAEKAGIDQSLIAQIERGGKNGSVKTLQALSAALGVAIEDILPMEIGE